MYYWVIALLIVVGLMILFWGSGQGPLGMRIVLFGMFTVRGERARIWTLGELRDLVRVEILRREQERENDEDGDNCEGKSRDLPGHDLFDRLDDAGFVTLGETRGPRLADIGRIDYESTEEPCPCCNDGALFHLFEICAGPEQPGKVGSLDQNLLGRVCEFCGHRLPPSQEGESTRPIGVIGPVIGDGANFFDVLEHFRELRKPKTGPEAATPEIAATAPLGTDQISELDAAVPSEPGGESGSVS